MSIKLLTKILKETTYLQRTIKKIGKQHRYKLTTMKLTNFWKACKTFKF